MSPPWFAANAQSPCTGSPPPRSVQLWVELAAQYDGKDRWYLEALGIGEKGKETACLHAWLKKTGADWNPR